MPLEILFLYIVYRNPDCFVKISINFEICLHFKFTEFFFIMYLIFLHHSLFNSPLSFFDEILARSLTFFALRP